MCNEKLDGKGIGKNKINKWRNLEKKSFAERSGSGGKEG